jgi:hypothetical protein
MYESFLEIIDGLSKLFEKIGSLPIYIDAGKKVLLEFAKGLLKIERQTQRRPQCISVYAGNSDRNNTGSYKSWTFNFNRPCKRYYYELPLIVQTALEIVNSLVLGILEALPSLLSTIISIIPMILTTLISRVPLLIIGIIGALPEIITAVIEALVIAAPEIILALIEALISSFVLYSQC